MLQEQAVGVSPPPLVKLEQWYDGDTYSQLGTRYLRALATYSPRAYSSSSLRVWWAEKVVRCRRGRLSLRRRRATTMKSKVNFNDWIAKL